MSASKAGWAFTPNQVTTSGFTNQLTFEGNAANPTTTISGTVKDNAGVALSGATLNLTGAMTQTTTSDANGNYAFTVNTTGNYTVVPSKSGYSFTPVNGAVSEIVIPQTKNFKGTPIAQANTPPSGNTLYSENVNYAYKSSGALASIGTSMIGGDALSTNNVIDSLSYRATGKASQVVYGNDRKLDLTYNAGLGQLTNMTATRLDGSDQITDQSYNYTDNGLISYNGDSVDPIYTRSYAYNYRNQMTTTYGSNYSQWNYSFDNFGNLLNGMTFPKIGTSDVPVNNRPSSYTSGGTTINFTYDQAGNMTAAGSASYQWDGANRLKSVNSGTLGSYGYDGNGKRVRKAESGAATYYVYSSVIGAAVMEVASAGVQRAYVMNGGSLVAQRNSDGQFYWLHTDHLGSGRKMTDTSGTMTYRAEFDPYGKLLLEWSLGNQANRNSKKFTGYERDAATGLDYAQARMYSSEWGRFMSPDPLGFASANKKSPKSLNRYSYVEGNPVNSVDPSGTLLANPDEPGGSACSMTIWGSGYRTDYGGFTFTNIWGGFWSCGGGISGGNSGGSSGNNDDKKIFKSNCKITSEFLADVAVNPGGSSIHATGLVLLGLGKTNHDKNLPTLGFKFKYTEGGQGGEAYAHIYSHAGATLIGPDEIVGSSLLWLFNDEFYDLSDVKTGNQLHAAGVNGDFKKYRLADPNNLERLKQIRAALDGDQAGGEIGKLMRSAWGKSSQELTLAKSIFDILCDY